MVDTPPSFVFFAFFVLYRAPNSHFHLESTTAQSRSARLPLIRHLVDIESQTVAAAPDLISTAQAAELLGCVAMLIDQNQLKGATVSAGGHRRVPRAAVLAWKAKH
jgi:excisionase family DNA binding protein